MVSVIDELKTRARVLQRQANQGDPAAHVRIHGKGAERSPVQRRECLAAIARELGFSGWQHAVRVLAREEAPDYGRLLYPPRCGAHTNIWCASYEEARQIRADTNGYLLAYGRHYFVADRYFVEGLGVDPDSPEWHAIGRDWVRPAEPDAWERLCRQLVAARLRASASTS